MRRLKLVGIVLLLVAVGLVVRNQVKVARGRAAGAAAEERRNAEAQAHEEKFPEHRKALLAELQPVTLRNCVLARVGGTNDAGYLMCANLTQGTETAYSYGIGTDDYWGCEVSRTHRVTVHQYDCFAPTEVVCAGAVFKLNNECVGPRTETVDGRRFDTIANQIARNGDTGKKMLVKIDIEGAEWPSILAAPDAVLAGIDQIAMEMHGIDETRILEGVRKLKTHFHVLSLHFNNMACTGRPAFPSSAYQVLLVNKRIGVVGPPPAGSPTAESLMAPDDPTHPDCQLPPGRR